MRAILRTRALILAYGLLSATLYCALLPLWEGFDELYHYGYVQYLSETATFPQVGRAQLSRELWTSIDFAPLSHFIQPYIQRPSTSFQDYFRMSDDERRARRAGLDSIELALRREPSPRDNYEVKQAPLTYLLLAPFERLLAAAQLSSRVLALRLLLAISTVVLLWIGVSRLTRRLGLQGAMEDAALLVIFSCQMMYATSCHIANDALMLPWLVFFITSVIDSCQSPTLKQAAATALLMALGLLIKASLLVLLPLTFAAPVVLLFRNRGQFRQAVQLCSVSTGILVALAGPWYLRNLILYHNFTATIDTTSGVGIKELLRVTRALPWRQSIAATAHMALWTGNNSFTSFSALTLNVVLALLAVAALMYAFRARSSASEIVTIAAIVLYCGGLIIIALSFFHVTQGSTIGPMPWYMPVLLAPGIAICFLGLARWQRWGQWIAIATVLLWAYVAAGSWLAKLVPLYGGFEDPHAHPRQLLRWYWEHSAQTDSILSTLCPAPPPVIYALLAGVLSVLLICTVATCFSLSHGRVDPFTARREER